MGDLVLELLTLFVFIKMLWLFNANWWFKLKKNCTQTQLVLHKRMSIYVSACSCTNICSCTCTLPCAGGIYPILYLLLYLNLYLLLYIYLNSSAVPVSITIPAPIAVHVQEVCTCITTCTCSCNYTCTGGLYLHLGGGGVKKGILDTRIPTSCVCAAGLYLYLSVPAPVAVAVQEGCTREAQPWTPYNTNLSMQGIKVGWGLGIGRC